MVMWVLSVFASAAVLPIAWRRRSPSSKPWWFIIESRVSAAQVPAIRAPLLLHYAGLDERMNAGIAAYETALKANGKRYTIYMYPGVNHAFNNDTGGARYNKEAANLAWERTLAFFKELSRCAVAARGERPYSLRT